MIDRVFLVQVVAAVLLAGGVAGFLVLSSGSDAAFLGFVVGLLMSTVNAVAGSLSLGYAFDKPQKTFLKVVFGGMAVRMAILLAAFYVLITMFKVDTISLTLSLLGFYLIFLIMEILSIQRRTRGAERPSL
jgi:hypothetical protein